MAPKPRTTGNVDPDAAVSDRETGRRLCGLVPTYDNPDTVAAVANRLREHVEQVLLVDDGSGPAGRSACDALAAWDAVTLIRRDTNGGKGAAVKSGLRAAKRLGFTHALQVDADGQHDLDEVPRFIAASREAPRALLLASPQFDATAPLSRRLGRRLTTFWIRIESGTAIDDAMCGFRVYPVDAALEAGATGNAMDFDPEIAVRMVWNDIPVINLSTRVRYSSRAEGGVSHFRLVRDNLLLGWLHSRLMTRLVFSRFLSASSALWRRSRALPER